jgi:lysophospholipase L1-like esterase
VELVTIGLGANELLRARRDPACEADREGDACRAVVEAAAVAAVDALAGIVTAVQDALEAAGSDARVLLLAYYNPDPDTLADVAVAGSDGTVACTTDDPGLDDRIACVAEERGTELVDLHAAFRGRELELTRFARGDVHPNAAGYAVIAEAIVAAVEPGRP